MGRTQLHSFVPKFPSNRDLFIIILLHCSAPFVLFHQRGSDFTSGCTQLHHTSSSIWRRHDQVTSKFLQPKVSTFIGRPAASHQIAHAQNWFCRPLVLFKLYFIVFHRHFCIAYNIKGSMLMAFVAWTKAVAKTDSWRGKQGQSWAQDVDLQRFLPSLSLTQR